MNKRDRSVANMRSEAQKIYHQRNEIKRLEKENKKQKEIIDKAIKYVNNHIYQETFDGYMDSYELKKLLDILKEVE